MSCRHCGLPLPAGTTDRFCCRGCRAVHQLLENRGLTRYYELRDGAGVPVPEQRASDRHWIDVERGKTRVDVDVQGIHCSGCVWVIERLFERREGAAHIELNPTLGRAELLVSDRFDLNAFVDDVESLGYRLGPAGDAPASRSDSLLIRTGICTALAGNGMFYAFAQYFGLREGPIHTLLGQMSYAAATLSVLIGGSVFVRAAWQGVRRRVLHLDLPIAVGIVLAYLGSTYSYFFAGGHAAYLDTLSVFIALMLLGRWLQERMLERNRRRLLTDEGAAGLRARRLEDGHPRLVPCTDLAERDELLVGPGDLVPVDSELLSIPDEHRSPHAQFSTDWIDGESEPRSFACGSTVPAGAFYVGDVPVRMRAKTPFAESAVVRLLRSVRHDAGPTVWWRRLSLYYVIAVLLTAGAGAATWAITAGVLPAIEVATAILVVTCPCAFGIAAPLAYEIVEARLRRQGLFVLRRDFFDRALAIRRIVFDKTGTLTTGRLRLASRASIDALSPEHAAILATLSHASMHPKSVAVADATPALPWADRPVREVTGAGLELKQGADSYRLGSPGWVGVDVPCDLVFARNRDVLACLDTIETPRPDAATELAALASRYELYVLSGDRDARVTALARTLGIAEGRAFGGASPEDKAALLATLDPKSTMMIGDGLNDVLAAADAGCAGTPAIDRPFLASRCDFYFTTPGLLPIRSALDVSHELSATLRANLAFAVVYNVVAVSLALAGLMAPWLAAILMPASSLVTVAYTLARLGPSTRATVVAPLRHSARVLAPGAQ